MEATTSSRTADGGQMTGTLPNLMVLALSALYVRFGGLSWMQGALDNRGSAQEVEHEMGDARASLRVRFADRGRIGYAHRLQEGGKP